MGCFGEQGHVWMRGSNTVLDYICLHTVCWKIKSSKLITRFTAPHMPFNSITYGPEIRVCPLIKAQSEDTELSLVQTV